MKKENKIKFGLKNVHYAKATETTAADGSVTTTYETPKPWPGAVSIALDPEGEDNPFYADDTVYAMCSSNTGYTGDYESAIVPEDVYTSMLGQTKTDDGVVLESSTDTKSYFALMFEFAGDAQKRRMVFYRCMLTRPGVEQNTKEGSVEAQTDSVEITITPRPDINIINGEEKQLIKGFTSADVNSTIYANWYKQVYVPVDDTSNNVTDDTTV